MFIYIKYGDGQHFLANTNCGLINFLHYMEQKLEIQHPDTVDLYDEKKNLKFLFRIKDPNENVENLFEPRGTYYACKIERNLPDNSFKSIMPLQNNPKEELIEALQIQCATLDQPKQQGTVPEKIPMTPSTKRGKISTKLTLEDEPVLSKGSGSGRSRGDQGKKTSKS